MFNYIKNKFFSKNNKTFFIIEREFPTNYFLNKQDFDTYKREGFIVLRNCISLEDITKLQQIYKKLTTFEEYKIEEQFVNSGRFQSTEIRNFVMENISTFSKEILPTIFNKDTFDENTTGAFQIKPPSKKSALNPHQDSPVIDETKQNALFVWIPLIDINKENGAVYVLPKSHLLGNHQRSLNVKWPFEKQIKLLWKYMIPVYLNAGDILCWDTALIHASSPNLSDTTRVAITSTILPKEYEMVEYFKDEKTPNEKIEKYKVEKSFWETEDIMKRPPCPPNQFLGFEDVVFNDNFSTYDLKKILDSTKIN